MSDFEPPLLISRLAPTPSGLLHLGNALSFVLTWVLTRGQGGRLLLRIDDLDRQRCRPAYLDDIFRNLDWLGLDYDLGPSGPDEFEAQYSQLHRMDLYEAYLARLTAKDLVYACACSRKRIRQTATNGGLYDEHCRDLAIPLKTSAVAWRVAVPASARVSFREWRKPSPLHMDVKEGMGDFVIRKKDAYPAYQMASLVDDAHWKVNFVVRGTDLRWSTAAQLWLAKQLDISSFLEAMFWHHGLVRDDQGQKLSKSKGAMALQSWRTAGRPPRVIYRLAAQHLDLPPAAGETLADLLSAYKNKRYET